MSLSVEEQAVKSLLAELTALNGPAGFEENVMRVVQERLRPLVDEVTLDAHGNVIGVRRGGSDQAPSVMLVAHQDEVGFIVTRVDEDGFLRIGRLGGPAHQSLPGQRVVALGDQGPLNGVIGLKPGHLVSGEEAFKIPSLKDLYVDVGATSREEVESWGVHVGTPLVFAGALTETCNPHRVFGKAIDDRAGLTALLAIATRLRERELPSTIYYAASVEEEIGLRGAAILAYHVHPDLVIALDTLPSNGTPDLSPNELPFEIGKGPVIKFAEQGGLVTHPKVRGLLLDTARRENIPHQLAAWGVGRTDASSAQQQRGGIASAVVGLPRRYSHSAVELLDLRDLVGLVDLLCATLPQIDEGFSLSRL